MGLQRSSLGVFGKRSVLALAFSGVSLTAIAQSAQDDAAESALVLSAGAVTDSDGSRLYSAAALTIDRATRTQRLQFEVSSSATVDFDGSNAELADPNVSLAYVTDTGPLVFNVNYSFSRGDVSGLARVDLEDLEVGDASFVVDDGTRLSHAAGIGVTYGANNPFGFSLSFDANDTDYRGTSDARLFDSKSRSVDLDLRFEVSRVLQVTAGYGLDLGYREDALNTDVRTDSVSLGFVGDYSRVVKLRGAVSWAEFESVEDDGAGGRVTTTTDNTGFNLGATISQRNGSSNFSYSRSLDQAGTVDRLNYVRAFDLTEVQQLQYGIGVAQISGGDLVVNGEIAFQQALKNGQIGLQASQRSGFTTLGDPVLTRQIGASYATNLTPVSALSADLNLASITYDDDAFEDASSAEIGVTYSHALTRDWDISARAAHSITDDGETTEKNSQLTLTVNRTIGLFR